MKNKTVDGLQPEQKYAYSLEPYELGFRERKVIAQSCPHTNSKPPSRAVRLFSISSNDLSKLGIILHIKQNNLQNLFKSCLNCIITASKVRILREQTSVCHILHCLAGLRHFYFGGYSLWRGLKESDGFLNPKEGGCNPEPHNINYKSLKSVYRLPSVGFQMKCLYGKSLLFGTLPASSCSYVMRGMAGHSKWSNIKHIKAANDAQKQKVFTKFSRLMRFAIKEGGSADPRLNSKLGKIVDQAKGNNMPMASIENVLKSAQKSQDNGKPYLLEYRGPGGAFLLAEVLTDNLSRSKQNIVIATKKLNMQELKTGAARCLFDEKGVIVSTCEGLSFEQAMDHAIEIGAEDVTGDEGSFVFTSAPEDFSKVKQALEENNYTIKSANVEFVACNPATISDQDMEKLSLAIEKMEELDDVMKVHVNL